MRFFAAVLGEGTTQQTDVRPVYVLVASFLFVVRRRHDMDMDEGTGDNSPPSILIESSSDEDSKDNEDDPKNAKIRIDMSSIPCVSLSDAEDNELQDLGVTAYDQSCYEENVMKQIDSALDRGKEGSHSGSSQSCSQQNGVTHALANEQFNGPSTSDSLARQRDAQKRFKDFSPIKRKAAEALSDESSGDEDDWKPKKGDFDSGEDEYDEINSEEESDGQEKVKKSTKQSKRKKIRTFDGEDEEDKSIKKARKIKDDGCERYYLKRMKLYNPSANQEFHELEGGLKVPMEIWDKLFPYQQTGVKWLWELHQACVGGIVGDEMGLGKTIQVIAFLAGLKSSKIEMFRETYKSLGPTVIVCPATVMHQWVQELHTWFPPLRVAILHATGSFTGNKSTLIRNINKSNGILITTYSGVTDYQDMLYSYEWHYVILDEGHKIRNPDAQTTIACKRFRSPHRIILSGSPIQNNLKELWSLFDFVYPGKLGTLPIFMEQFSIPITQGGYANASDIQVKIAFKCATVLKNTIKPYLLRRMKEDVNSTINLPKKNEQVLFCKLTDEQTSLYQTYLDSAAVKDIFRGSPQLFVALINLRKICNHPSLFGGFKGLKKNGNVEEPIITDDEDYGYYRRSGKMQVVDALLRLWFKQGHKILLFTQGTQMMTIIEKYLRYKSYTYLTMDGSTPIGSRQSLIKQFNEDKNIFVFLLTTRVGGIGVNLVGANRVIIFDPDWNPSTDLQARERAWRIGQEQSVTIYRLLTAGTIEEKIYHRQVFKMYLTNRVLKDPKQRRFFKTNDLYELFTLGSVDSKSQTESSAIFAGTGSEIQVKKTEKKKKSKKTKEKKSKEVVRTKQLSNGEEPSITLDPEKVQELRERAKMLSQMLASKFASSSSSSSAVTNSTQKSSLPESHESCSTSRKKSKKGLIFEGERIKYLVKQDTPTESRVSEKQDEYVLKKLFSKSTSVVHSAIQHDVIEGTKDTDYVIIEKEAEKVASDAIEALKKSRTSCFAATSGIPNWTGVSGFMKKSSSGPGGSSSSSSSSLLQAMKQRSRLDRNPNSTPDAPSAEHEDLLRDLKSFLSFQSKVPGQATTKEILDKFGDRLPPSRSPVFKALLWKLADFYRNGEGIGVWKLKFDFL